MKPPRNAIVRERVEDHRAVELTPEAQFEAIYRLTYQKTLAYARRRTVDMSDALDVVSETYLVAWRRLDSLLAVDEPQFWLYGVASRILLNLNRGQRRRESLLTRMVEVESGRSEMDPAESVELNEELIVVLEAMEQLSDYDRELLLMAAYEELSHTRIAIALGTRPSLVGSALFRARRRLEHATVKVGKQRIGLSGHIQSDRPTHRDEEPRQ